MPELGGHIEVVEDNGKLVASMVYSAIQIALERVGIAAEGDVVDFITENYIVDTGRLRDSITHRVLEDEKAVIVGTNVEYALYVHEGTSRMKGRPYLTSPVKSNLGKYKQKIQDTLQNQ